MELIDWRELYAANRAVIEGSPKPRGRQGARRPGPGRALPIPPDAPPGGTGTWERFTYSGPSGSRPYFLYTPRGLGQNAGAPMLVMLHGCTQTPADLARGTRMNEAADRHGFVVAYPEQTDQHNPQSCWNWFLTKHQARESGEPALLAGITEEATARLGASVDPSRVFVAGMSAGAAAAVVLAATYADLFSALGVHSGLHYRIATSQRAAFEAMRRGGSDPARSGADAFEAMGDRARVMPTIVVHGDADGVVHPVNGDQVVEQWLATNGLAAAGGLDADIARPSAAVRGQIEDGHSYARYSWIDSRGRVVQEYMKVEGLGHAWSGGDPAGSYTDPSGPDASEAMWEFFAQANGS